MGRLTENSVLMMKNMSFSLTAKVDVPESGAEGVIMAQGGVSGGHSLYVKDGKPKYAYNFFGLERVLGRRHRGDPARQPPGPHGVRLRRRRRRQGRRRSRSTSTATPSATDAIEQTEAFLFSADETCDVGDEYGSPVTTDYTQRAFTGEVEWVEIDLGLDDHNHLIKPEDRVNLAMGIQ